MVEHVPRHDHLLRARPEGEVLRRMDAQARRSRLDRQTLIQKSGAAAATLSELDRRVGDVQRDFAAQKVGQRQYVVDANGFGTHLTIQEAVVEVIAAATVSNPTAVVYINPGTYVENITVDVTGSALTAISFVAEGMHGTASELVFPSEVEGNREFVAAVTIQPDNSTVRLISFVGTATESGLFATFVGIQIDGQVNIASGNVFETKLRLVDSYINYTGISSAFGEISPALTLDVLLLRSLVSAPNGRLFGDALNYKLFAMTSRVEVDSMGTHSGAADPENPFVGTIAAFQTCHLNINSTGFTGEYLFFLLFSSTVSLPDTAGGGGVELFNGTVVGNIGFFGAVIIDDELVRTAPVISLNGVVGPPAYGTRGIITGTNLYGRGDVDPLDVTPEGTGIYVADTTASVLNITNNRFIGYAKGVDCVTVSSLGPGSIIGPNTFTLVTTPYTNIPTPYLYQWPLMKARVAIPRPVAILSANALFIPIVTVTPTNTSAIVGLVHLDSPLEVTKLTYRHGGGGAVGATVRVALYSEDGQTKFFDVTDAVSNAAASDRTVNIAQQVLPAGNYYIFVCAATATVIPSIYAYDTFGAGSSVLAAPTGAEHDIEGAISIGAGLAPPTFDPTSFLLPTDNSTAIFRMDGVAS